MRRAADQPPLRLAYLTDVNRLLAVVDIHTTPTLVRNARLRPFSASIGYGNVFGNQHNLAGSAALGCIKGPSEADKTEIPV